MKYKNMHARMSNLNVHKSNMLKLLTNKQLTYTYYTRHDWKKKPILPNKS